LDLEIAINRKLTTGSVPFKDVFIGFEKVAAVKSIFGKRTNRVLSDLHIDFEQGMGYMRIDDKKGSVIVSAEYLKDGDEIYLYLDIVHELVHIRQRMEGQELWDRRYPYVDRPTEIEAYRVAVQEARRIGLGEKEIASYLKVEWVNDADFERFLENLGIGR